MFFTRVTTALENDKLQTTEVLQQLQTCANVSMEQYKQALSLTKRGRTVVLERTPQELFINCYNPHLLSAWQANLDLQHCLDPYACIAYMVSYITKDERDMSSVLQNVSNELHHHDWREQLTACAPAFLNAREISAPEAVYRLLSFLCLNLMYPLFLFPQTYQRSEFAS